MVDVSVIIVNYKTPQLVAGCVRSVMKKTCCVDYEIIIVDNHSGDDIATVVERLRKEEQSDVRLKLIQLTENIGFGKANNKAIAVACGRNILFLNPDTLLLNDAVSILSVYLDKHDDVGGVGGNLYDEVLRPALSFRRLYPGIRWELSDMTLHKVESLIFRGSWCFNKTGKPMSVAYCSGADLMIRRSVIDSVGYFAPEFFMYYEETDLCRRIRRKGYRIVSVPEARIQHLEGKSFRKGNQQISHRGLFLAEQGRCVYYRKNVGRVRRAIADGIYSLSLRGLYAAGRLIGRGNTAAFKYRLQVKDEKMKG